MSSRRVSAALAAVMTAVGIAGRAHAQAAAALPAEVEYSAPAGCPDRAAFLERVRQRLASGRELGGPRKLTVRIDVQPQRVRGEIAFDDPAGSRPARTIEAATCAEASDALALIAALALGAQPAAERVSPEAAVPAGRDRPPSPPTTEPKVRAASGPAAEPSAAAATGAASAGRPAEPDDHVEPGEHGREHEHEHGREDEHDDDDGDDAEERGERASAAGASGFADYRLELWLGALALSGIAPDVQPAAQVALGLRNRIGRSFELSLRVGGRAGPTARIEHAQGAAELDFLGGLLAACGGARFAQRAFAGEGCLVLEPGRLTARGMDTDNPRTQPRLWLALGPAAHLAFVGAAPFLLAAEAELQFPLRRDRFLLAGETVYRVPAVAFRGGLSLGLQLW